MGEVVARDRATLPQGGSRAPAAGAGEDAADLLSAAVVQSVRPSGGRRDLRQRVDATLRAGWSLGQDEVPDETTILRFRHLLEQHGLTEKIFEEINGHAGRAAAVAASGNDRGRDDHRGPELDEERSGSRDPEMKQTRKKGKNGTLG